MKRGFLCCFVAALLLMFWAASVCAHGDGGDDDLTVTIDWLKWGYQHRINVDPMITSGPQAIQDDLHYGWNWAGGWAGPASRLSTHWGGFRLQPNPVYVPGTTPSFNYRARLSFDTSFTGQDRLRIRIKYPWGPAEDELDDIDEWWLPPRSGLCQGPNLWIVGSNSPTDLLTDWNTISPRIGFTYDVTGDGSNVVRGGFGIFYNQLDQYQIDLDKVTEYWPEQTRWGSFADNDLNGGDTGDYLGGGLFYKPGDLNLGGPILKDKLWFFGWQCCPPREQQNPYSLGKISDSFSLSLDYTYNAESYLPDAMNPRVNPFLALAIEIQKLEEQPVFIPNKISF
ncbi:MAG: hypothetical protein D6E12_01810 [Desulfovibrio sp.]|nr:MAG: hypothetical protein D6E12_01810 [Desulfovibrio sp.]